MELFLGFSKRKRKKKVIDGYNVLASIAVRTFLSGNEN